MIGNYSVGIWDVEIGINLSNESLVKSCEADHPTCVGVFDIHPFGQEGGPSPHRDPECRLCAMIEQYVKHNIDSDVDTISYTYL